ncbi:MAG: glycosyl transferase family 36 [Chlorobi bacterium]|nr:glycosyl transferase family 36 [Chlorobiota bacterium]
MKNFETKYGYFDKDGKEYVIKTPRTPKPWVNVISNGRYGLVISQTGGGFSWLDHSEFNRITRWHQDLIRDNWGKYIYIKNNETGDVWSPTWSPVKTELDNYECRYGTGYAKFVSEYKGIEIELLIFVPFDETLEIWDVKIKNRSDRKADLSIFTYFEWALGSSVDFHREFHKQFLETDYDESLNAITAKKRLWDIPLGDRGHWNVEYDYVGFFSCGKNPVSYDGDKEKFIGQYGSLEKPAAVANGKLSETTGAFNDSIASLKVNSELETLGEERINFFLGLKKDKNEISESLSKYSSFDAVDEAFYAVKRKWNEILGNFEINTPDTAMNYMVNTWTRYQAISGRLWGRTAYYQQSGAFGFRDQLQDSLVWLSSHPELTKKQIKLHSRHQFSGGEVLHWWHPISETGLATEMTDDMLWLPFVVHQYIMETGDYEILNNVEPYFDEQRKEATILEHCDAAINKALNRLSERGLPLIGAGDWNDGMSAVGLEMKGESFWLAEFLYKILRDFSNIYSSIGNAERSEKYEDKAAGLRKAFCDNAWDGEWFLRATKDSGEKIGAAENGEGQIYLNPQTWAAISEIAGEERERIAMNSAAEKLLKKNGCLLLRQAYGKPDSFIGYLTRYAAGRRENGGVYSHASTWAIWAFAKLNENKKAFEVYKRMNPIYSGEEPDVYVAEPFVMPGNIDGPDSPNYGMGGWTWYTGSAAWYQKVIVDWILGVRAGKDGLIIDPHIPESWMFYSVKRYYRGTEYLITVINPFGLSSGKVEIEIDGEKYNEDTLNIASDKPVKVTATLKKKND